MMGMAITHWFFGSSWNSFIPWQICIWSHGKFYNKKWWPCQPELQGVFCHGDLKLRFPRRQHLCCVFFAISIWRMLPWQLHFCLRTWQLWSSNLTTMPCSKHGTFFLLKTWHHGNFAMFRNMANIALYDNIHVICHGTLLSENMKTLPWQLFF